MRQGARTDLEPSANLPEVSQSSAASMLNVSERTVRDAAKVGDTAAPEIRQAVDRGKLAVSATAQAVKLPPAQQRSIAEAAEAGATNAVRSAIKQTARAERETERGSRKVALPDKKYGVILADPELRFEPWSRETGAGPSCRQPSTRKFGSRTSHARCQPFRSASRPQI